MQHAILIDEGDLTQLIRNAVRTELTRFQVKDDNSTPVTEGDIDFAVNFLQVYSKMTVYGMTCRNEIPHTKRGKRLWFNAKELDAWLEARAKKRA